MGPWSIVSLVAGAVLAAGCSVEPEHEPEEALAEATEALTTADGCQLGDESLASYARTCKNAMGGIDVPSFDCTKGVEVPDTQGDGLPYPSETCDRPNVLNGKCDPGSKFQVLVDQLNANNQRVVMVAHCRHKGSSADKFKDVAVIAYNTATGDTCFFQDKAPGSEDTAQVPAPKDDPNLSFWSSPADTAGMQCVGCHDNGPFIRSPYLTQLKGTPAGASEIPTILAAQAVAAAKSPPAILPGSRDVSWNSNQPYRFVGANFQGWKAYALSVQQSKLGLPSNECTSCHRMGISSNETAGGFSWFTGNGTAQRFGRLATGDGMDRQEHKNPHTGTMGASVTSPIWMLPSQKKFDQGTFDEAILVETCAKSIIKGGSIPAGCGYVQFAQGNTCQGPPITATVNGGTVGPVTTDPHIDVVDIPAGGDVGFGGWTSIHGPFVEKSTNIPFDTAGFDGTVAALLVVGNPAHFQIKAGWDGPPANPPRPGAGGKVDFTLYKEINTVPANPACGYGGAAALADLTGTIFSSKKQVDSGLQRFDVPTSFIGNLSFVFEKDFFGIRELGPVSNLQRQVSKAGAFESAAFTYNCSGWTPTISVLHKGTSTDVELIAAPNAKKHRCVLTGIGGNWTVTASNGTVQPSAEIYSSGQSTRLRVFSPSTNNIDRVYAEASCIQIQP
jgi:hypothetical protein